MNEQVANHSSSKRSSFVMSFIIGLMTGMMLMFFLIRFGFASTPPAKPRVATSKKMMIQPRFSVETSGYSAVLDNIDDWGGSASLEEIAKTWDRIGYRCIEQLDAKLRDEKTTDWNRSRLMIIKSLFLNYEGAADESYKNLEQLRAAVEASPELRAEMLGTVMYLQGIVALRRGENDNCVMCRGESSCILPISKSAVHTFPTGSRLAVKHFTEYLEQFPEDIDARWLLNLAHMTLGEHPGKVDPRFLISIDSFVKSEIDIGRFRDIGHVVGVNRFNQAGGSVMDDFDNDGRLDLAVSSFDPTQPIALYQNKGDGTFKDNAESAGIKDQLGGLFCCQTDYNNDGLLDIWVSRGAWLPFPIRPSLLKNNGDGTFTDVTTQAGVGAPCNSNSASWGDYDNDGWLDLFIPCEQQPNLLYHNKGDGTFEEVAAAVGVDGGGRKMCKGSTWIDYDNDSYPDLFLNYLGSQATLFRNNHDGTFTDVTLSAGIVGPAIGFSCWAWDYDNDGWQDLFVTSYDRTLGAIVNGLTGKPHDCETNKLYRNVGGTGFVEVGAEAGLTMSFATMGSNYGDFNNDGYLDMYLATGEPNLATLVPNRMFLNVGGKRFSEITGSAGTGHLQKGHSVSCGDWDRDGDIDIFAQIGGATCGDKYHNILFQNPGQQNHALTVRLVGKKTNRAALGARIKAVIEGETPREIHRHVSSGSSFGANALEQSLGLGQSTKVDRLEIYWPTSKTTQVFRDLSADQLIEITEFSDEMRRIDVKPIRVEGETPEAQTGAEGTKPGKPAE